MPADVMSADVSSDISSPVVLDFVVEFVAGEHCAKCVPTVVEFPHAVGVDVPAGGMMWWWLRVRGAIQPFSRGRGRQAAACRGLP